MRLAKIVISDETNCKLLGLDLSTRKTLVNKFKYQLPYARHLPSVKLGRWDGCKNYFNLGGSTYINLLPEIVPVLEEENYDVEIEDLRDYVTTFEFEEVHEDSFGHICWPKGHRFEGEPIKLRDDQVSAVNVSLSHAQSIQCLATGFGKTIVTAALSQRCEKYGRTIIIVPNKSLVTQTEEDYVNMQLDVGVYYGDRKEWNKAHTICTWQSLNNLLKATQAGEAPMTIHDFLNGVVAVIVDEVHQAKADVLTTLLTGVMARIPIRWGLTGTIPKEKYEYVALQVSFGEVVNSVYAADLQDQGVLANCHVNIIQLIDYVEYKTYQEELRYLLENNNRLVYLSKLIVEISKTGNTLVLVDRVAPGKALANLVLGSVFLSGATKSGDRKEHYTEYAERDDKVSIATYGIAAVGLNIPRIFNLVLIEPGKSFVRVIQSIGRGIRKAQDKDHVEIWDITSTCKFVKRHLTKRKEYYREARYPFTLEKTNWSETTHE